MTTWIWDSERGAFVDDDLTAPLRLADSWLVRNGRVRAFERHRARFEAGARELGVPAAGDPAFWRAIAELLPEDGAWFPRVELLGDRLVRPGFRLRPAPEQLREARVWIPPFADPRLRKRLKGPDLPLLGGLRDRARREHGCDEVLLVDRDGHVIEAANSNILWWEGDVLCRPDPALEPFGGITAELIVEEAARRRIETRVRRAVPEDVQAGEAWLTSALHGIRRVAEWSLPPLPPAQTLRFEQWRRWLDGLAEQPTLEESSRPFD